MTDAKKVILVVDDAPANIQIALAILKDIYQVRIATNGAKALELAASQPVTKSLPRNSKLQIEESQVF
jgi:CheY-like chemotaxis protein